MSIFGLQDSTMRQYQAAIDKSAQLEQQREIAQRQADAAETQGQMSMVGTGAGIGMMVGGPVGAVVGAGIGYLTSELF